MYPKLEGFQLTSFGPGSVNNCIELQPIQDSITKKVEPILSKTFAESMWANIKTGNKVLSFTRTVCQSMPNLCIQPNHLHRLGVLTNGIGIFVQGQNLKKGIDAMNQMDQISDKEGANLAKLNIGASASFFSSGVLSLQNLIAQLTDLTVPFMPLMKVAASIFSGIGSILGMGISGYRLGKAVEFRWKLNQKFHDPKAKNAMEQAKQALEFLKNQLAISKEDVIRIGNEVELKYSHLSTTEKEAIFNKACRDLAQVKVNTMKRLSSMKSVHLVASQVDQLLMRLNDPNTCNQAIQETAKLVETALIDNGKKTALFVALLIASTLAFIGFIAATLFTAGTLPLLLEIISSAIGLSTIFVHWVSSTLSS